VSWDGRVRSFCTIIHIAMQVTVDSMIKPEDSWVGAYQPNTYW